MQVPNTQIQSSYQTLTDRQTERQAE